jgi:hypothetical protein
LEALQASSLSTYRDVDGFFTKYFERKDWTERTKKIYRAVQGQHVNSRWTDFPDSPVQNAVYDWWFRHQEKFFSSERGVYYISTSKHLTGSEAQRQVDLFVKPNSRGLSKVIHNWKDVEVIGELKESNNDKKGALLQIGRYIRKCLAVSRRAGMFTRSVFAVMTWRHGYSIALVLSV